MTPLKDSHATAPDRGALTPAPESKCVLSRRAAMQRLAAVACAAPAIMRGRYALFATSSRAPLQEYSARAVRLVQESVVIDLLNQFRFADFADKPPKSQLWLNKARSMTPADYEVYRTSGYSVMALGHSPRDYADGIDFFAHWNGFVAGYPDWFMRIDDPTDFDAVKKSGKVGIMITFQNSDHFRSPDDVDTFFGLGQRLSQLTYNYQNRIGSGFLEEHDGGLTVFGRQIVERMEKVGMAVDVSHCGDRTSLDAFEVSKRPVLITHSNARALNPGHPRCKPDDVIRACGKAGSVMGITGVRNFVKDREPTTIEDVLNHFDYVAKMIGVEHVGIGSDIDLDGYDDMPPVQYKRLKESYKGSYAFRDKIDIEGLDHPKRMFDLTEGLIRRRYSDADIKGILGGNFVRVLGESWKRTPVAPAR